MDMGYVVKCMSATQCTKCIMYNTDYGGPNARQNKDRVEVIKSL